MDVMTSETLPGIRAVGLDLPLDRAGAASWGRWAALPSPNVEEGETTWYGWDEYASGWRWLLYTLAGLYDPAASVASADDIDPLLLG
jgi:hypothetical protein